MKIKHGFGLRAHDLIGLFDKTNKISTFMNKLEKQSLIDPLRYDSNKYKGDGFEFLVEISLSNTFTFIVVFLLRSRFRSKSVSIYSKM
jgi:hypothetical protein